jgi:putative effector of murein hydrolase
VAVVVVLGVLLTALFTGWLSVRLGAPEVTNARTNDVGCSWPRRLVLGFWSAVFLASAAAWFFAHAAAARAPLGVALAVLGFVLGEALREYLSLRARRPLALFLHPVLVSACVAYLGWRSFGFEPAEFLATKGSAGRLLMAMLPPAVAALGLALDRERSLLARGALTLCLTTLSSSAFSLFTTALGVRLLGIHEPYARALLPRAVTTPVALAMAAELGADPGLTAVFVITSGVLGALFAPALLARVGFSGSFTLGVATGASCHGIGTAALVRADAAAAAVSGISFALTAAMSVILITIPGIRALLLSLIG